MDAAERFLVRMFLRRYVTYCARRGLRQRAAAAASLAGSLEGLRNVVVAALVTESEIAPSLVHAKALGGHRPAIANDRRRG